MTILFGVAPQTPEQRGHRDHGRRVTESLPFPSSDDLLRFDRYQERCLYDPDVGFFATGRPSRASRRRLPHQPGGRTAVRRHDLARASTAGGASWASPTASTSSRSEPAGERWRCDPRRRTGLRCGHGYTLVERSAALRADATDLLVDRVAVADASPGSDRARGRPRQRAARQHRGPPRRADRRRVVQSSTSVDGRARARVPPTSSVGWECRSGSRLPVPDGGGRVGRRRPRRIGAGRLVCIDYGVRDDRRAGGPPVPPHLPWPRARLRSVRRSGQARHHLRRGVRPAAAAPIGSAPRPSSSPTSASTSWSTRVAAIWAERAAIGDLAADPRPEPGDRIGRALTDPTASVRSSSPSGVVQAPSGAMRDHKRA